MDLDAFLEAHNLLDFPVWLFLAHKLLVACMRSVMSDTKKNSQNKSCKHTGYMPGALSNKLLTIHATAKTGWEVNPPSLTLPLCLSLCASVWFLYISLCAYMLYKHEAKGSQSICLFIYACSWSCPLISVKYSGQKIPAKRDAREARRP